MIVSREIDEKLLLYLDLLKKWHTKINLTSKKNFSKIWERHILDSSQAYPFVSQASSVLDVGTGAGFPGLILAIMGIKNIHLVEANRKKIVFLQEAIRLTEAPAILYNCRVEDFKEKKFNCIVSRAFASIEKFIETTVSLRTLNSYLLCFKGPSFQKELDQALMKWHFEYETYPSVLHEHGKLVILSKINKTHVI